MGGRHEESQNGAAETRGRSSTQAERVLYAEGGGAVVLGGAAG